MQTNNSDTKSISSDTKSTTSENTTTKLSPEENNRKNSDSLFEGLLLTTCAARGPENYIKFMSLYQVTFL